MPLNVTASDWRDIASRGLVSGVTPAWSFGRTGDLTTGAEAVDLWPGKNVLGAGYERFANPSDTPTGLQAWSTSPADTGTIGVYYLGAAGDLRYGLAVLQGTTHVAVLDSATGSAASGTFANGLFLAAPVSDWGVASGNVVLARSTDATKVYKIIPAGGNVCECCGVKVPSGKRFVISNWSASTSAAKPVTFYLRSSGTYSLIDGSPVVGKRFLYVDMVELSANSAVMTRTLAIKFPAGSVVKIGAKAASNGGSAVGGFDGWFENE